MEVYYRDFMIEDLPRWTKMAHKEFLKGDFCSKIYLLNRWDMIQGWIIMTEEDEWIGCCFNYKSTIRFKPVTQIPTDNKKTRYTRLNGIEFLETCIFPKYRGQGFGRYIMKLMHKNSVGYVKSACIKPNNQRSINLCTQYGFKKVGTDKANDVYLCDDNYFSQELEDLKIRKK